MVRSLFVQFTLFLICIYIVVADDDNRSGHFPGSLFWPPYTSHLLQSTKAQTDDDQGTKLHFITKLPKFYKCHHLSSFDPVCSRQQRSPDYAEEAVGAYRASARVQVSKPAPDFEGTAVVDGEVKTIKLNDYKGKYLVFFFYPLDFTFVCPTEIIAFSDRIAEFRKINTEVVAASVDSHFTHLAWINTPRSEGGLGKMKIPLLSDLTHKISRDYGVLLEDLGHTLRGLFIIDPKGVLRQITMNDLPVGRSVDETLRLVQAFQYTDEHGEVCPADWEPGQDTIIPDHKDKVKYFHKTYDGKKEL